MTISMLNRYFSLLILFFFLLSGGSAIASDSDGSIEAMWNENANVPGNAITKSMPVSRATEESNQLAGICSLDSFLDSEVIKTSTWPGIGPFKADVLNPLDFKDSARNHLNLTTAGKEITCAQLDLTHGANQGEKFLTMQMAADFLLEALGIKPAKIHEFNLHIEKEKTDSKKKQAAFSFKDGLDTALISVQSLNVEDEHETSQSRPIFRVKIESVSKATATPPLAPESIASSDNTTPPEPANQVDQSNHNQEAENTGWNDEKNISANVGQPKVEQRAVITSPIKNKTGIVASQETSLAGKKPQISVSNDNKTTAVVKSAIPKNEKLKQEFMRTVESWQSIKKKAVRQRQTNDLASILGGRALVRQSDAVKWLSANHKYYDMNPKGVSIQNVTELSPDKKYTVSACVKENTKYFDDTTGQLIKDMDDTYNVNYTIEKAAGHWVITDSTIVKSTSSNQAQKSHR